MIRATGTSALLSLLAVAALAGTHDEAPPPQPRTGCRHGQYGRKRFADCITDTCLSCRATRVNGGEWMEVGR